MCVALPGKVIGLDGTKATVDFSGNIVTAEAGLVKVNIGDRVLVHAGCIIQTMDDSMADELEEMVTKCESWRYAEHILQRFLKTVSLLCYRPG